jgi:hypothetical protein
VGDKRDDGMVTTRRNGFYWALSKLLDGKIFTGQQLSFFFNLLYKAMK